MELPVFFLMAICYLAFALFIITTVFITLWRGVKECKLRFSNVVLLISEIIFTTIAPLIGFMRFDKYQPDIPFAKEHVLTIILLVAFSSASFWIARLTEKSGSPLLKIVISVGLLQGIILCGITTIHFLPFFSLGLLYPMLGFELLSPLFAFVFLLREFYFYSRTVSEPEYLLPNRKELGFLPLPSLIFQKPLFTRVIIYVALLLPFIALEVMLACGCGQEIDSIIKAFTHSTGFIFSRENY